MTPSALLFLVVGLSTIAFFSARGRAVKASHAGRLPALPKHYGALAALWSGLPALILLIAWLGFKPTWLQHQMLQTLPTEVASQSSDRIELYMNQINLAIANAEAVDDPVMQRAIEHYHAAEQNARYLVSALITVLCLSGIVLAFHGGMTRIHAR